MGELIEIVCCLLADAFRFAALQFCSTKSLRAENLFLRRQLALFMERGVRPRRLDAASRVSLAILARMFDWRDGQCRHPARCQPIMVAGPTTTTASA